MKRVSLLLLAVFSLSLLSAKDKLVDKSGKMPKWVNGVEKNYIITSAQGASIEEAKQKVLEQVKTQIVLSVAQTINATSSMQTSETSEDGISTFLERYTGATTSSSADQAYLQGISLNSVDEYYWEHWKNTKTDKEWYVYHLKYPFSIEEQQQLVNAFKKEDQKMTIRLAELETSLNQSYNVDEWLAGLAGLRELVKYFPDQRKQRTQSLIEEVNHRLKSIRLEVISHFPGNLNYVLYSGDQVVTCSKKPHITANCATVSNIKMADDHVVVTYQYDGCYSEDLNYLLVYYKFGNAKISDKLYFDMAEAEVEFFVHDGVKVYADRMEFEIICEKEGAFTIDGIRFNINGKEIEHANTFSPLLIEGAGVKNVAIPIDLLDIDPNIACKFKGIIYYTDKNSGKQQMFKLLNVDAKFYQ